MTKISNEKQIITVGIPCYSHVSPETLDDYMRFFYYLGRRYTDYEFTLAIKSKSEQFRARNAIVTAALQVGSKYLLFLDDDHVIDTDKSCFKPSQKYEFLRRLINKLEESPENGIAGTLYYQRGGSCKPVAMLPHPEGGYRFLLDHEVNRSWQEVSVVGGGCMLINMEVFDKIPSPWFQPENDYGTDIQVCSAVGNAGYKVFLDSSQIVGHVLEQRTIITDTNRHQIYQESFSSPIIEGLTPAWQMESSIAMYVADAIDYTGKNFDELNLDAIAYEEAQEKFDTFENKDDYYKSLGNLQLSRQVVFHCLDFKCREFQRMIGLFNFADSFRGLDFGCGSAPVGYELAARGHVVDFVDIDGAGGYEFLKWRVRKNGVRTARFGWSGDLYDYALLLDSIEHIVDWQLILKKIIDSLKPDGKILTNYFINFDFNNPEHVSMDHKAVKQFMVENGVTPINEMIWTKTEVMKDAYNQ